MFVSPSNMFVNFVARGPLHVLSKFTIDEISVTMCAIRNCNISCQACQVCRASENGEGVDNICSQVSLST